jgi:hypothetical protein
MDTLNSPKGKEFSKISPVAGEENTFEPSI